jgi:HPt (histidine-containing phosphotransfer) domain-containing protein
MDLTTLALDLGMEKDEALELIEFFLETSAPDLGELHAAIEEKNGSRAARSAHSIKGAVANLRLTEIYELARKTEMEARENRLNETVWMVGAMREELNQIAERLKQTAVCEG